LAVADFLIFAPIQDVRFPPKPAAGASNGDQVVAAGPSADRPLNNMSDAEVQQGTASGAS
jgi:hypothetical protein